MWNVISTQEFGRWFDSLEPDEKSEVIAKVDLLKAFGPQLKRPHADTLKGSRHANLKELRADTATAVMRIAFAFDPLRTAVILVGGDKAGVNEKRFYKQLIGQAESLFDRHLDSLPKKK